jgi:predicted porin
MKKSLIALAVLAASGAAMAQSSVTLYGLVDAAVDSTSSETTGLNAVGKLTQTRVSSSALNNSRWGLKGSEDLGGGLSAVFALEAGFNTDTGSAANLSPNTSQTMFGRQAFVGLNSNFGTVSLGRQYTAYDALRGATNNTSDYNFATTNSVWGGVGLAGYSNRTSNSIAYTSPDFSGISGAVVLGLGENKTATNSASSNNSLHIKYANGPVLVGYAYQQEKIQNTATSTMSNKYNLLAGSYDFGVAKLVAGYNDAKNDLIKEKDYQVGVSAPFGAAVVYAGYSHAKAEGAGFNNKGNGFDLVGTYSLSKRTTMYAGYYNTKVESNNGASETKTQSFAAGVRHTF